MNNPVVLDGFARVVRFVATAAVMTRQRAFRRDEFGVDEVGDRNLVAADR